MHVPTVWHDLECGAYTADLPLWREVAEREHGPILDVGAGTGAWRATSPRAATRSPRSTSTRACSSRSPQRDAHVETVVGDARDFDLGAAASALSSRPMQTVQLLGGRDGRIAFLRRAREHLEPGGLLSAALTGEIEIFDEAFPLPPPDVTVQEGRTFSSQPVVQREEDGRVVIKRFREIDGAGRRVQPRGRRHPLDVVEVGEFEDEARAEGFRRRAAPAIGPTEEHVGSIVVMLRG